MRYYIRFVLTLIIIVSIRNTASSQSIEFGVMFGASNYYGDLSNEIVMPSQTHPSGSIIGRYNLNERWSIKGMVAYGRISGADSLGSSEFRKVRNLSFYSDIYEFSVHMEWNMKRNVMKYNGKHPFIPYFFFGLGVFNFNPKVDFAGNTYELQPLGTEGQGTTEYNDRRKYSLTQICIPLGIGIKKKINSRFSIGIEVGPRFTFTNYLDDVGSKYADTRVVGHTYGPVAKALSNRTGEKNPPEYIIRAREGDVRSFKNLPLPDLYFIGGISVTYIFRNHGIKCPKF